MTIFTSVLFGIVEGITEFLPISSTGHLLLTAYVLDIEQTEFQKSFEIAIQLGAILAAVAYYGKSLAWDAENAKRIAVAFLPTAIIGFVFHGIVKAYLLESVHVVLWSLFLGGFVILGFEQWYASRAVGNASKRITYPQAFLIGLAQSLALIPGVSRSAATIIAGMGMGLERKTIVDFSFLLAIPTMAAATGFDLYQSADQFSVDQFPVLAVGFISSFVVALGSIAWLLRYIRHHSFRVFGVYRIALACAFWLFIR